MKTNEFDLDKCVSEGPQSALERRLIRSYLQEKGYRLEELPQLPPDEFRRLMREACQYASLKLAEVESRAHMRREIRPPD